MPRYPAAPIAQDQPFSYWRLPLWADDLLVTALAGDGGVERKGVAKSQAVIHKLFDLLDISGCQPRRRLRLRCGILHRMGKIEGKIVARWSVGERVATPNGFVAEIVSLTKERALIRYLSIQPDPGEIELPFELLRPATAHDLFLARIK